MRRRLKYLIVFVAFLLGCACKNAVEYDFSSDLIRSLHYCQWAFVYEGKRTETRNSIKYDIISANFKLSEAKSVLLKYKNNDSQTIKKITESMIKGINDLLDRNQRLLAILDRANASDWFFTNEQRDEIKAVRMQKRNGLQKIRASASLLFYLITEPGDRGIIQYRVTEKQRLKLLKKLNVLFEGLIRWQTFNITLAEDEIICDRNINNWLIFDLNKLRDSFVVDTYEEAKAKGLLVPFDTLD